MLSGIVTVLTFAAFIGVVWWAWDRRNSERFEAASQLPLEEDSQAFAPETGGRS